jgi:midasin
VDDLNWPLEHLGKLFTGEAAHSDGCVRFLAIRCFSLQTRMGEAHRNHLIKQSLGAICGCDIPMNFGHLLSGEPLILDGWAFPLIERKRLEDWYDDEDNPDTYFSGTNDFKLHLHSQDLR